MRASLIIAAHNESDRLWRTVASCVETSAGLDCEIVVADDASWDDSVEETLRRFPQVRVVRHEERKGASPTKDLGARHARGDTLIFLDGHTKPEPGAIQRLIEDVERLKGDAIITPSVTGLCVTRWKSLDHQQGHGLSLELEQLDSAWLPLSAMRQHPHRGRLFYESPALAGGAFAVHRELYDDLRGFDPHMLCWGVEDLDFGLKCWLLGHPILHDPEPVIGHRFQQRFDNFVVPVEQLIVNQLRMARKNFTDSVWNEWIERCRRRYPGKLTDHPEGLWARVWQLFGELRPSAEQERAHLLARRVHDEFWYAERFNLSWPQLQREEATAAPSTMRTLATAPESAAEPEPVPSPSDFSHHLDAVDDSFSLDASDQSSGNVVTAENEVDDQGHDTYDGAPITGTTGFITTLLQAPQHGTVTLEPNGHFTYTRAAGYTGSDSFTYELRGPNGETDQATVNIHGTGTGTDDHEPEFTGDHTVTIPEDTVVNTVLLTVAATDQDGGTLTYSILGGNDDGLFEIGETDGVIRLVNPLDYETAQSHTLTVKAMDTTGLSATTNATNIDDVNEPPVFVDPSDGRVIGLVEFDYNGENPEVGYLHATDSDGDDLFFGSDDASPTFRVGPNGRIVCQDPSGLLYGHIYEFTADVEDGNNPPVEAAVRITVNPLNEQNITAMDDQYSFSTSDGSPLQPTRSVLANDIIHTSHTIEVTLVSSPLEGVLALNSDGTFTYTPISGASYATTFVYEASFTPEPGETATVTSSQATVTINMYYQPDEFLLEALDDDFDESVRWVDGVYRANVLSNDTIGGTPFIAGSNTTVTRIDGSGPRHGTLVLNNDGTFEYTRAQDYHGDDSFSYRVSDNGQEDEATVLFHADNESPQVDDVNANTTLVQGVYVDIVVVDAEGDAVHLGLWDIPKHGGLRNVGNNRIYYQPSNDYVGVDTFTVRAYDPVHQNRSNIATVTITVSDDPTLRPSQTHSWGQFVIGFVKPPLDVDTDPGAIGDVAQIANPSAGHNRQFPTVKDRSFDLALREVIQEPEVGRALASLLGFGDTFSFSEEAVEYMAHFLSNQGTISGVDTRKLLGTDNGAWGAFSEELFAAATFVDSMSHTGNKVFIIDSGAKLVTTTSSRWNTALGQFTAWMDGRVEHIESRIANGVVQLRHSLRFTWHVWDPYDWNPTIIGSLPWRLAQLHLGGLAKQFLVVGEFKGTISWWDGDAIPEFARPWGGELPS